MMRKEAREWCQYEDGKYIDHLKAQIEYFNQRLVVRSMEGSELRDTVIRIIDMLEDELEARQFDYDREYPHGNKTGKCIFEEPKEDTGSEDGCASASDNVVTNAESQDTRAAGG